MSWSLHPERALPSGELRPISREIYHAIADLPLVSMHGHVDVRAFAEDAAFPDPAQLLVVPDHYLVRMLVSQGVPLPALGIPPMDGAGPAGAPLETDPRAIWRRFCSHWALFRGTPTRYWLEHELIEIFGVTEEPSAESADRIFDEIAAALERPDFRPRALFQRFNLEILATTDGATDDLAAHRSLARQGWGERIVPTFRPDPLLHVNRPDWAGQLAALSQITGVDAHSYEGYLSALRQRRRDFRDAGARATDHGHLLADTTELSAEEATRIFAAALSGKVTAQEAQAFSGHMLFEMARMSCEDGLVMQLHPGSLRDHDRAVARRYGHDKGFDIPIHTEYTRALRPVLEAFGHHRGFRFIVFTLDETAYSRELAPLAGAYPAMRLGAPWWFLDSPEGMRRFRESATETAGFYNTTGFVDDTRAYASIPARHDLARRIDAGFLARLVAEHRMGLDEAIETAIDLSYHLPKAAYPALPH
ncbi:glucuronate isomerase [Bogoriella caseilytica]|uniref:Uronate isomerase n=1 Tax=Bogoriella caseilytica TaxID=56055 RepID=A0A3N2BD07_9MICO|nr:glucuronate isomerase [Bogoriella caseilytica]ROR73112.1 glucuronate isomerase [Bogoriella caseilytica]